MTHAWATSAEGTSSAASPLLNGASSSLGPERHSEDKPRQTQVQQQQQQQQHSAQISHQVDEEEAAQQKPAADDYSADDAVAYEALLQQQVLVIPVRHDCESVPLCSASASVNAL